MNEEPANEKTQALPARPAGERENTCPYCEASIPPNDKYCPECGYEAGSLSAKAPAEAPVSAPVVEAVIEGQIFGLTEGEQVLGRSEGDIVVSNAYLSRRHLALVVRGEKLFVRDLGSTNGTFVNGERLQPEEERELSPECALKAGELPIELRWLELPSAVPSDEAAAAEEPPAREAVQVAPPDAEAPPLEPTSIEVAEVKTPWLLQVGDARHELNFGEVRIGRKTDRNDLAFPQDGYMSGAHALLDVDLDYLKLKDLGSTNGTLVNGEKVAPSTWIELTAGDEIQAGKTRLVVEHVTTELEPEDEASLETDAESPAEPASGGETESS